MSSQKYVEFSDAVKASVKTNAPYADKCLDNLRPSLIWVAKYLEGAPSSEGDVLLKGCYGAAVEAVSLVSFGLIRPAVLSLRSHYELSLQYLYYKDHPVEWRNVQLFRSQPNLPGVNKKYLRDNFHNFENRQKLLTAVKNRTNEDCYDVLSGVAHGTAINSISSATEPKELLEAEGVVSQTASVFFDVGECLSDIHVACFESNWLSLPKDIRESLKVRFGSKSAQGELGL